ncbi:MAG: hypothetical protein ACI4TS_00510, partial [Bacteroidaceae bacterium]
KQRRIIAWSVAACFTALVALTATMLRDNTTPTTTPMASVVKNKVNTAAPQPTMTIIPTQQPNPLAQNSAKAKPAKTPTRPTDTPTVSTVEQTTETPSPTPISEPDNIIAQTTPDTPIIDPTLQLDQTTAVNTEIAYNESDLPITNMQNYTLTPEELKQISNIKKEQSLYRMISICLLD